MSVVLMPTENNMLNLLVKVKGLKNYIQDGEDINMQ